MVNLSCTTSTVDTVVDGVPQGSVLGPTLFICFINDLVSCNFEGGAYLYADDTALYYSDENLTRTQLIMNRNLVKLLEWTRLNRLTINARKTKFMAFSRMRGDNVNIDLRIGQTKLERREWYDHLGIRLDSAMSFEPHITNLLANCSARLSTLSKIRRFIDQKTAVRIYKGIIMSKLQYGLLFSLNAKQSVRLKLQKAQKRALRVCALAGRYESNLSLHKRFNVLPFALHCKMDLVLIMYKYIHRRHNNGYESPRRQGPTTRLRATPSILVKRPNTLRFIGTTSYVGPDLWNSLPTNVKLIGDYNSFKKVICSQIWEEFNNLTVV